MSNGLFEASFGIVKYPQSVIHDACGFRIDRKFRPYPIRNAELGLYSTVEDPYGLDELVVFYGFINARIGSKTIYPGAIIQQGTWIGRQDTKINIRLRSSLSTRMRTANSDG